MLYLLDKQSVLVSKNEHYGGETFVFNLQQCIMLNDFKFQTIAFESSIHNIAFSSERLNQERHMHRKQF